MIAVSIKSAIAGSGPGGSEGGIDPRELLSVHTEAFNHTHRHLGDNRRDLCVPFCQLSEWKRKAAEEEQEEEEERIRVTQPINSVGSRPSFGLQYYL